MVRAPRGWVGKGGARVAWHAIVCTHPTSRPRSRLPAGLSRLTGSMGPRASRTTSRRRTRALRPTFSATSNGRTRQAALPCTSTPVRSGPSTPRVGRQSSPRHRARPSHPDSCSRAGAPVPLGMWIRLHEHTLPSLTLLGSPNYGTRPHGDHGIAPGTALTWVRPVHDLGRRPPLRRARCRGPGAARDHQRRPASSVGAGTHLSHMPDFEPLTFRLFTVLNPALPCRTCAAGTRTLV